MCIRDSNYSECKGLYNTASYFGVNKSSFIWAGRAENYKIVLIIGAIILLVFIILLITSFLKVEKDDVRQDERTINRDTYIKLTELNKMLDEGLISQEEF